MGTWNAGIFDDDIALDIQSEFNNAITEGMSVKEATIQILEYFEDVLEDEDEAPIVYLTLAALQINEGTILKDIKKKALEIIESGRGLDRWQEAGEYGLSNRIRILNKLREKLVK